MDVTPAPVPPTPPGAGSPSTRSGTGRRRGTVRVAAVAVLTAATSAVAIGAFGPTAPPAAADGLRSFDGCDDLRTWYVDALRPLVGPYGLNGFGYAMDTAGGAERAVTESAAPQASDGAVGNGATGTNLQEAGVDEPDVMKTSDGRLFTTVGDRLVVLDVTGEEPRELGSLEVPALAAAARGWGGGWGGEPVPDQGPAQPGGAELLLDGDRVLLLSSAWLEEPGQGQQGQGRSGATEDMSIWPGPVGSPTTTTTVVDVSDPGSPRLVSQQEVEGTLVGARLSDGVVRVVTTSTPTLDRPDELPVLPGGGTDQGWEAEATEAHLLALVRMSGEQFLPEQITRDADGAVVGRTPAVACSEVTHPTTDSGAGMLTVRSLDLTSGSDPVVDRTAVATDGELIYASADRLYVATTRGGWSFWTGLRGDVPQIEEPTTELHGFATDDGFATTYLASGEVDGVLLGRWAMSARDGRLRVATTVGQLWAGDAQQPPSESFVTVLEERDGDLVQEGQVGGLGKGETIRAVRWFDDVATVVTFRQTDPLYVVDLSDPAAPRVTGELKVPGLLRLPAPGRRRSPGGCGPGRDRRGPHDRRAGADLRHLRPRGPHPGGHLDRGRHLDRRRGRLAPVLLPPRAAHRADADGHDGNRCGAGVPRRRRRHAHRRRPLRPLRPGLPVARAGDARR